jgi:hypothetical protein
MGFLNTTPEDDANLAAAGTGQGAGTTELPNPGFWTRTPGALARGAAGAVADIARTGEDLAKRGATEISEYGQDLAHSLPVLDSLMSVRDPGMAAAAMDQARSIPEAKAPIFESLRQADKYRNDVIAWANQANDPRLFGGGAILAGHILKGGIEFGAGDLVAGPWGGAALLAGSTGDSAYHDLRAQGVDDATAQNVAAAEGLAAGVGATLPFGAGDSIARSVLQGALLNTGLGIAGRGAKEEILRANGYDDMASQQRAFDGGSLLADGILGAAFGFLGHAGGDHALPGDPLPSEVDAASAVAAEDHFNDVAPGVATRPDVANAHVNTLYEHMDAMLHDREPTPPDADTAQTIANGIVLNPENLDVAAKMSYTINSEPVMEGMWNAPEVPDAAPVAQLPEGVAVPVFDGPVTGDAVQDQALAALVARDPGAPVTDGNGIAVSIADYVQGLRQQMADAEQNSNLVDAAVQCFASTGAV